MNLDADSSAIKLARQFHRVQQNNPRKPQGYEKSPRGTGGGLDVLVKECG